MVWYETSSKNPGHGLIRHSTPKAAPPLFTKLAELIISLFRRLDSNKDGRLSRQELKNAFNSLGSKLPTYRALMGLYKADENRDGYITEEEMDKLVQYALSCGYHVH
ncbi:hypothetical protein PTKIN_Ptkin08bG0013200 [Pterospermum kingtungense]